MSEAVVPDAPATPGGRGPAGPALPPPPPLLLAPMRVEELAVRRGVRRAPVAPRAAGSGAAEVQRIGIGPVRATAARVRVAASLAPGRPVLLVGLGGGLRAGQRPADVIVASSLSSVDSDETVPLGRAEEVAELIQRAGAPRVSVAPVVSSARIVHGAARRAAAERGAAAVDMESLWFGPLAQRHPFAVVRVLIDVPGVELSLLARPGALIASVRRLALCAEALAGWAPSPTRTEHLDR